jgi:hypothetical protein
MLVVFCVCLSGCSSDGKPAAPTDSNDRNRVFEYSGSAVLKETRDSGQTGRWSVRLTRGGRMTVVHSVGGRTTQHGSYFLTEGESSRQWSLIDKAELASARAAPGQQTIAVEARHVFTVTAGGTSHRVVLPAGDISGHEALDRLRAEVAELIELYVGIAPAF